MQSFIFGGNTDISYEELQRRRKANASRRAFSRAPQNAGEGINAIGAALAGTIENRRLNKAEGKGRDAFNAQFQELFGTEVSPPAQNYSQPTPEQAAPQQAAPQQAAPQPAPVQATPEDRGDTATAYAAPQASIRDMVVRQQMADDMRNAGDTVSPDPHAGHDHAPGAHPQSAMLRGRAADPGKQAIAEWMVYRNKGKTRNKPINDKLIKSMSFLGDMGVQMRVESGGQDAKGKGNRRTGSTRHDHGNSADVDFFKDGRKLKWSNPNDMPLFREIVQRAKANGVTGIGAGIGNSYMGDGRMHVGFGKSGVWGAKGKGANAPKWLRDAYNSKYDGPRTSAPAAVSQNAQVQTAPQQTAQATGGRYQSTGGVNPKLLQLMANPYASAGQKALMQAMVQQQVKANAPVDPYRQLQMQKMQLEVEQMRNPTVDPMEQLRMQKLQQEIDAGNNPKREQVRGQDGALYYVDDQTRVLPGVQKAPDPKTTQLTGEAAKAAGLDPNKVYNVSPDGKVSEIGGGGTNVDVSVGKGETEFDKTMGKKYAETAINTMDAGRAAPQKIATLKGMRDALANAYSGTGGDAVLKLRQAALAMGFGDDKGIADAEFAKSVGNKIALELRNPAGGAGMPGAMSDKDREFLMSSVPGLTKSPEGNAKLIDYMIAIEERNVQVATMAQQYMAENNGRIDNGFYSKLAEWSAQNTLFSATADPATAPTAPGGNNVDDLLKKYGG